MKRFAVSAVLAITCTGFSQTYTSEQVKVAFDKAMRTGDGKLFFSVLREGERKSVTPQECTAFLKKFVTPWYTGPSLQMGANGKLVRMNDPNCKVMASFTPTGGCRYTITERKLTFETPTLEEGKGSRSTVGFAQTLFAIATAKSNSTKGGRIEQMKYAQSLVESWIPSVVKMGIPGSVDPELNKYQTWAEIIKASRAEVKKYGG